MSSSSCSSAVPSASAPRPAAQRRARLAALLALLLPALAGASWHDDVGAARLIGEGDLRQWGFLVYHARLWGERAPVAIGAQPFALELTYQRAIRRDRIVDVSIAEMQRLLGDALTAERREQWRADRARWRRRPGRRRRPGCRPAAHRRGTGACRVRAGRRR